MKKLSPLSKVISFLILISAVIASGALMKVMLLSLTLLAVCLTPSCLKKTFHQLSSVKWFFLFIITLNTLFSGNGFFTPDGFIMGLRITVNCITVIMLSSVLTSSTGAGEIAGALSFILFSLKFIFFPVKQTALILSLSLQFIPMLSEESERIKKAQRLRGVGIEGGAVSKAKAMLSVVIPLFILAFQRADSLALAMEARGIESADDIPGSHHFSLGLNDALAIFISSMLLTGGILL